MPISKNKTIKKHVHIMIRWKKIIDEMVFKCDDPDCQFTRTASFLEGKRSICGVCKTNELILTKSDLKMARPRCAACSNKQEAQKNRQLTGILEDFLTGQVQK